MNYRDLLTRMESEPMAMMPERLAAIQRLAMAARLSEDVDGEALADAMGTQAATARANPRAAGNVAVYPITGMIMSRAPEMFQRLGWAAAPERVAADVQRLAADPNVKAIVLDVDSPGGYTSGVQEAAEAIRSARGATPIIAVSNALMASASYDLGAAATEVVASPSSLTGSIGVWMAHSDYSKFEENIGVKTTLISAGKYKTTGNPYEPLGDEARARLQMMVDGYYSAFVASVAKSRGVSAEAVRSGYGEGDVLRARQAKDAGLVDREATLDETIKRFGGGGATAATRAEVDRARAFVEVRKAAIGA